MINIGIAGGTGYTAGELLRILINHPQANIKWIHSASQAALPVSAVHTDLAGETDLVFTNRTADADVVFLCLGHGLSAEFLRRENILPPTRIIDLGSDFRTSPQCGERQFVYGLPEANRADICQASSIANPGCFATAIELAVLPLAVRRLLHGEVHIHAITGSSGAGRSLAETSHFSYRCGNVSVYKPFAHQHLAEVRQTLEGCGGGDFDLCFVPVRGGFVRGIFASIYTACPLAEDELNDCYSTFYKKEPFVHIVQHSVSLKDAVNTNKCVMQVQKIGGRAFITAAIDNLLKGASGQAVQNMNLMFGLPETTGLKLKGAGM